MDTLQTLTRTPAFSRDQFPIRRALALSLALYACIALIGCG
jgi:hypothetical protein